MHATSSNHNVFRRAHRTYLLAVVAMHGGVAGAIHRLGTGPKSKTEKEDGSELHDAGGVVVVVSGGLCVCDVGGCEVVEWRKDDQV